MNRDLEVRHCRALVAIDANGGIGAAARALGLAQSTVSETLLSLERLLGTAVTLRRSGREAVLTKTAEALLPYARTLITASEGALAACAHQGHETIRLGTVESISSYVLPGPLVQFRTAFPHIDVRITTGTCADLRKRVNRFELDAAFTIESSDHAIDLGCTLEMWPARVSLVVSPSHPLAHRLTTPQDLEASTFLFADSEGAFNEIVSCWLRGAARPSRFESAGSISGVKWGIANGRAIGVLADYSASDELAAGTLVALETTIPLPPVSLRLTTSGSLSANTPLAALVENIRGSHGLLVTQ